MARKLVFVTAHSRNGAGLDLDWTSLADPEATLAIYMGKAAAPLVTRGLIEAGLSPDTPVALVENASLEYRYDFLTTLSLLPIAARTALGEGPAVILVGKAISAAQASVDQARFDASGVSSTSSMELKATNWR
jgi:uroporphyrin-III C-methyltransferase